MIFSGFLPRNLGEVAENQPLFRGGAKLIFSGCKGMYFCVDELLYMASMLKSSFCDHPAEAGVDEAGRGCLAGPVVAAAVILPQEFEANGLNDSKKLAHKQRMQLREVIINNAQSYGVGVVWNEAIDHVNILNATYQAMHLAIKNLQTVPGMLLIDGNRFKPYGKIPFHCVIQGDAQYMSIAAASILAKTHRDQIMSEIHLEYPCYRWNSNKGYPTKDHKKAIFEQGLSPYHRKSFGKGMQYRLNL